MEPAVSARARITLGPREADALMTLTSAGFDTIEDLREDGAAVDRALFERVLRKVARAYQETEDHR
jgi:hypothetical protein